MSDDKTIVISTHQVRDIDKVLDHVLIMDNSRVLLDESTASICSKLFFLESDDRELACDCLVHASLRTRQFLDAAQYGR